MQEKYELVVGLEIHMQLDTESKAFCADPNQFGDDPNVNISAISLGHPGTLPMLNAQAVESAISLGLAVGSTIREDNQFARKNYFYADLSKGYQITQHTTPICTGGRIVARMPDGGEKVVDLTRIHMEEDAGKSLHDQDLYESLVDYNRCGVPLLEMVTEPDIRSADEAYAFLTQVRKLVRHLRICDGNMEEGSLRCDVNISVRPRGQEKFGTKVEIKNLNSFRNVSRAIGYEFERQVGVLEEGGELPSETRTYDAQKNTTAALRSKELANDYRYFPEPDLPRLVIDNQRLSEVQAKMPELPEAMFLRLQAELGLSAYDAELIAGDREWAEFYAALISKTTHYKAASNWIMGPIRSYLNKEAVDLARFPLSHAQLAELIDLVEDGKLSFSTASQQIFPQILETPARSPLDLATELGLLQVQDDDRIIALAEEVMAEMPEKVAEYRAGKKGILGLFVGQVMRRGGGKLDPRAANAIVERALEG